jgi:hypothetical protein
MPNVECRVASTHFSISVVIYSTEVWVYCKPTGAPFSWPIHYEYSFLGAMLLQTGAQCGSGLLLGEPATSIVSHILLTPSLLDSSSSYWTDHRQVRFNSSRSVLVKKGKCYFYFLTTHIAVRENGVEYTTFLFIVHRWMVGGWGECSCQAVGAGRKDPTTGLPIPTGNELNGCHFLLPAGLYSNSFVSGGYATCTFFFIHATYIFFLLFVLYEYFFPFQLTCLLGTCTGEGCLRSYVAPLLGMTLDK